MVPLSKFEHEKDGSGNLHAVVWINTQNHCFSHKKSNPECEASGRLDDYPYFWISQPPTMTYNPHARDESQPPPTVTYNPHNVSPVEQPTEPVSQPPNVPNPPNPMEAMAEGAEANPAHDARADEQKGLEKAPASSWNRLHQIAHGTVCACRRRFSNLPNPPEPVESMAEAAPLPAERRKQTTRYDLGPGIGTCSKCRKFTLNRGDERSKNVYCGSCFLLPRPVEDNDTDVLGVDDIAEPTTRYDFGPGIGRCSMCRWFTLNRGDEKTKVVYCEKCFPLANARRWLEPQAQTYQRNDAV